jgi:LysM repeat protein
MSEQVPEPQPQEGGGGGNFMTRKYFGLPGIVWLGGAAVLAYFLFFRNSSSSSGTASGTTPSGSSGAVTVNETGPAQGANQGWQNKVLGTASAPVTSATGGTGSDTSNMGINPGQGSQSGTPNPQPTPAAPPMTASTTSSTSVPATTATQSYTYYTVQKGDTLASVAKKFGITVAALAAANVYVKGEVPGNKKVGQPLGTGAGLLTGQVLKIPQS